MPNGMPRRDFAEFAGAIQQASRKRALEKKGKIPARLAVHSAIERVNCAGPAGLTGQVAATRTG